MPAFAAGIFLLSKMNNVKPKKYLGQHFLNDTEIAQKIVNHLSSSNIPILEIGPGMGILTQYLLQRKNEDLFVVEIDTESVAYLKEHYPQIAPKILETDFLKLNLNQLFSSSLKIIGNFPYNISSQILFKILENKDLVGEMVGMFQKEVAERIASKPGKKQYGILSVLLQAFYDIEYLFTVDENSFYPPPKVKSSVIRITRNSVAKLQCNEEDFKKVVKMAFNQRRKTLRNSLKTLNIDDKIRQSTLFDKRPEQLTVGDFEAICLTMKNN